MTLGDDYVPIRKIGYLSPLPVIDNGPYEFYHLAPARVMMVTVPVGLSEFSVQDVERVLFAPIEKLTAQLCERKVDIIVQGGVPLGILLGPEKLRRLLDHIQQLAKLPATAGVLCVVEAAKALGVKKIAVANKWNESMNRSLAEFFAEGGIEVVGTSAQSMMPSEFVKMSSDEGVNLAYELGRAALQAHPEADSLYIGGGAWLTRPAVLRLEQEFEKPVIANGPANVRHVCRALDCWQPKPGHGKLIALP